MKMTKSLYGKTADGKEVFSFTIKNESGAEIELLNYGATLNKISVPDRNGDFADVLVGFDTMEGQLSCTDSQGRTVGRVANRISGNGITIDGKNYRITKNIDGKFTLHGNHEYENAVWNYEILGDDSVKFSYFSADGNEGFPSNLQNEVTFTFTDKNEVKIHYDCRPDGKTPINVTNHSYFNLGGYASGNILSHEMQIFAKYFTPMNEDSIPTGEIRSVENTPFDFRIPKKIGRRIFSRRAAYNRQGLRPQLLPRKLHGCSARIRNGLRPRKRQENDVLYRPSRSPVLHRQLYGRLANR